MEQLAAMGFNQQRSTAALSQTNGDVNAAMELMLAGLDESAAANDDVSGDLTGSINYRRHNGTRQASIDIDGNSFIQSVPTFVRDARCLTDPPTVETMGFALRHSATGMKLTDFYDDETVQRVYYPLCEQVIIQETGAVCYC